jgi:hypothetical protein
MSSIRFGSSVQFHPLPSMIHVFVRFCWNRRRSSIFSSRLILFVLKSNQNNAQKKTWRWVQQKSNTISSSIHSHPFTPSTNIFRSVPFDSVSVQFHAIPFAVVPSFSSISVSFSSSIHSFVQSVWSMQFRSVRFGFLQFWVLFPLHSDPFESGVCPFSWEFHAFSSSWAICPILNSIYITSIWFRYSQSNSIRVIPSSATSCVFAVMSLGFLASHWFGHRLALFRVELLWFGLSLWSPPPFNSFRIPFRFSIHVSSKFIFFFMISWLCVHSFCSLLCRCGSLCSFRQFLAQNQPRMNILIDGLKKLTSLQQNQCHVYVAEYR